MFGETTGEVGEFGLPIRLNWARDYRGKAQVIYGHTPVLEAEWLNDTLCIDTGCAFGGKLTAFRWPERTTLSVPAERQYAEPAKPLNQGEGRSAQQDHDRLLYFYDYAGKCRIETRFYRTVVIPEENSLAALEVASRFAVDPRWLIYLPPTMAPCPTAPAGPYLEYPDQALDFYAGQGVTELVVEEKHMGSRAVLVLARDADVAKRRFGVEDGKAGVVYTRTGRSFLQDSSIEASIIERATAAVERAGLWQGLEKGWLLLDAELMPWSAKAQSLLSRQYYPTVAAARSSAEALDRARPANVASEAHDTRRGMAERRREHAMRMGASIDGYCWSTDSIENFRLAPFHLLAAEGQVFADRSHRWHMEALTRLVDIDPILQTTGWRVLDAADEEDRAAMVAWWLEHTNAGGEGLVVKPASFIQKGTKGYAQPAVKVRGKDYLRIIYGPDYDVSENIERLRRRGLGRKQSMVLREFAPGLEGLHRFVERTPLAQVHACILGVLALESEPVDPRL